MIAIIDVGYFKTGARSACVVIEDWEDSTPAVEHVSILERVLAYQPGEFYRRELPCIQAVLSELSQQPDYVVIDGYVWLDDQRTPGLGAHLYSALKQKIPVIGVAKNSYRHSQHAIKLLRGRSQRALFVTAAGMPAAKAAEFILRMHGDHRLPTIIKRADQLSRTAI